MNVSPGLDCIALADRVIDDAAKSATAVGILARPSFNKGVNPQELPIGVGDFGSRVVAT